jgi:hypothetical protein
MKFAMLGISAAALSGCATMDASRNGSIKSLGNDQYSISEMAVFGGSLPEHAARHCASMGKKMKVEGNTTQQGLASGTSYGVLIFSCYV